MMFFVSDENYHSNSLRAAINLPTVCLANIGKVRKLIATSCITPGLLDFFSIAIEKAKTNLIEETLVTFVLFRQEI